MTFMFGPLLFMFMIEIWFDHRGLLLWRLRRVLLGAGMMLQRTEVVLILQQILAMLAILNELSDSAGQEGCMRKIPKGKFREEKVAIASDLEGSHLLPRDFDDTDNGVLMLRPDSLLKFLSKREVSGLIVSSTPSVLLAIGAYLDTYLYLHLCVTYQ